VAHEVELLGQQAAIRDLHPDHLVVTALALAIDAVVQPEHPEDVVIQVACEVPRELGLELLDVGELRRADEVILSTSLTWL
jgi:hypothetical protein